MKLQASLVIVFTCFLFSNLIAQDEPAITFNKVKPADFTLTNVKVDTSYGAVIVADIGRSYFEGNSKGWFSLIYEHKRRIKVIDKKGFDLATIEIPLYKSKNSDQEEKLESIKASTYNLEDGKVVETKLDKDNIFKDKLDDNHFVRKFTMPAVKDGSIIEYSYKITSDYLFNLQPWTFQGAYPRLWSEYKVTIPSFFKYVSLNQGYFPFHIKSTKDVNNTYMVREVNSGKDDLYSIPSVDGTTRWVVKDIPAMKEEKFTSSLSNHIAQIEFQLSGYDFPEQPYKSIMGNWQTVSNKLLEDKDFGAALSVPNNWLNDDLRPVVEGAANKLDEATRIYKFVQHNIKNKGTRSIYLTQTPKETLKSKNGYVADINMLLTIMLNNRGFNASPVLLSTRANGFATDLYPIINKFNYVVCKLVIENTTYYLDASQPYLGFNKLPSYAYNGHARTINNTFQPEYFLPDNIYETKVTSIVLSLDEKNRKNWTGKVNSTLGYYESSNIRQSILEKGKDAFVKKIQDSYTDDFKAEDVQLKKLDVYEQPLEVSYSIAIDNNNSDLIYLNPMIKEGIAENFFRSQERLYPVEMPYKFDETYMISIPIPEGYVIDELPKSTRAPYNDGEALFEYIISKSDKEVNLKAVLKFEKATFTKEDYESLRGFFDYIVKKHAEQIVFKKK